MLVTLLIPLVAIGLSFTFLGERLGSEALQGFELIAVSLPLPPAVTCDACPEVCQSSICLWHPMTPAERQKLMTEQRNMIQEQMAPMRGMAGTASEMGMKPGAEAMKPNAQMQILQQRRGMMQNMMEQMINVSS